VKEGNQLASKADGIQFIKWEDDWAVFEVKSGNYSFSSDGVKKITTQPYVSTPVIAPADSIFPIGNKTMVTITCAEGNAKIHYSINGADLNESSPIYENPIEISANTILRAQAFLDGYKPSNQSKAVYSFIDPLKNGIIWTLYRGRFIKVPDVRQMKPAAHGSVYAFGLTKLDIPKHDIVLQFKSFIQIDKPGKYTFYLTSNDGSNLYVNDRVLIDNDGEHGAKEMSNTIDLEKGRHELRVDYFNGGGGKVLSLSYSSNEISYQPVPEYILFKSKE